MKLLDGRDWLRGNCVCSDVGGGRGMLSKSLIQFSVDGRDCIPSLLSDMRPNYGEGNEDHGNLLELIGVIETFAATEDAVNNLHFFFIAQFSYLVVTTLFIE